MLKSRKVVAAVLLAAFGILSVGPLPARAEGVVVPLMPTPGTMVPLGANFVPAHLQGIVIHPDNALQFDFLVHKGKSQLEAGAKNEEYGKLVKYFLAALTVRDGDQWVNLSPYEKGRIIEDGFGKTGMGRDLLAQDYLLKQITSSLMYPESGLGKTFWNKIYAEIYKQFGATSASNIPVNTFNKVWIVPDQAVIYESGNTAYITSSHLKVMLEQDYLAVEKNRRQPGDMFQQKEPRTCPQAGCQASEVTGARASQGKHLTQTVIRAIILPALEKEVNEGQNFAPLRQIYSAMILATWYKRALKDSILTQVYTDKSKIEGLLPTRGHVPTKSTQNVSPSRLPSNDGLNVKATEGTDPLDVDAIYQRYLEAFKKGVYNYIKEETDQYTNQVIPRKYFAGGFHNDLAAVSVVQKVDDNAMAAAMDRQGFPDDGELVGVKLQTADAAEVSSVLQDVEKEIEGLGQEDLQKAQDSAHRLLDLSIYQKSRYSYDMEALYAGVEALIAVLNNVETKASRHGLRKTIDARLPLLEKRGHFRIITQKMGNRDELRYIDWGVNKDSLVGSIQVRLPHGENFSLNRIQAAYLALFAILDNIRRSSTEIVPIHSPLNVDHSPAESDVQGFLRQLLDAQHEWKVPQLKSKVDVQLLLNARGFRTGSNGTITGEDLDVLKSLVQGAPDDSNRYVLMPINLPLRKGLEDDKDLIAPHDQVFKLLQALQELEQSQPDVLRAIGDYVFKKDPLTPYEISMAKGIFDATGAPRNGIMPILKRSLRAKDVTAEVRQQIWREATQSPQGSIKRTRLIANIEQNSTRYVVESPIKEAPARDAAMAAAMGKDFALGGEGATVALHTSSSDAAEISHPLERNIVELRAVGSRNAALAVEELIRLDSYIDHRTGRIDVESLYMGVKALIAAQIYNYSLRKLIKTGLERLEREGHFNIVRNFDGTELRYINLQGNEHTLLGEIQVPLAQRGSVSLNRVAEAHRVLSSLLQQIRYGHGSSVSGDASQAFLQGLYDAQGAWETSTKDNTDARHLLMAAGFPTDEHGTMTGEDLAIFKSLVRQIAGNPVAYRLKPIELPLREVSGEEERGLTAPHDKVFEVLSVLQELKGSHPDVLRAIGEYIFNKRPLTPDEISLAKGIFDATGAPRNGIMPVLKRSLRAKDVTAEVRQQIWREATQSPQGSIKRTRLIANIEQNSTRYVLVSPIEEAPARDAAMASMPFNKEALLEFNRYLRRAGTLGLPSRDQEDISTLVKAWERRDALDAYKTPGFQYLYRELKARFLAQEPPERPIGERMVVVSEKLVQGIGRQLETDSWRALDLNETSVEEAREAVLAAFRNNPEALADYRRIYNNLSYSDDLIKLIGRFADVPGIQGLLRQVNLRKDSLGGIYGFTGELHHAWQLARQGYRILGLGLRFEDARRGNFLDVDIILEKDGKFYVGEIKHNAGRGKTGPEAHEASYVDPREWTKMSLLRNPSSRQPTISKFDRYARLARMIQSNHPHVAETIRGQLEAFLLDKGLAGRIVDQFKKEIPIIFSVSRTSAMTISQGRYVDRNNVVHPMTVSWMRGRTLPRGSLRDLTVIRNTIAEEGKASGFNVQTVFPRYEFYYRTPRTPRGAIVANRSLDMNDSITVTPANRVRVLRSLKEELASGSVVTWSIFTSAGEFQAQLDPDTIPTMTSPQKAYLWFRSSIPRKEGVKFQDIIALGIMDLGVAEPPQEDPGRRLQFKIWTDAKPLKADATHVEALRRAAAGLGEELAKVEGVLAEVIKRNNDEGKTLITADENQRLQVAVTGIENKLSQYHGQDDPLIAMLLHTISGALASDDHPKIWDLPMDILSSLNSLNADSPMSDQMYAESILKPHQDISAMARFLRNAARSESPLSVVEVPRLGESGEMEGKAVIDPRPQLDAPDQAMATSPSVPLEDMRRELGHRPWKLLVPRAQMMGPSVFQMLGPSLADIQQMVLWAEEGSPVQIYSEAGYIINGHPSVHNRGDGRWGDRPKWTLPESAFGGDTAMSSQQTPGGIDLNARHLDLQIKRDGNGIPLPLAQQDMAELNRISGFTPVITSIQPASALPLLNRLRTSKK